jgi:hypothetical protein
LEWSLYEFGKGNLMAQDTESESTQLFQFDPADVSKPVRGSIGLEVVQGVVAICSFAVVVALLSAGVVWVVNRTPKPDASAERERLDKEYYDWTKERPKDAASKGR